MRIGVIEGAAGPELVRIDADQAVPLSSLLAHPPTSMEALIRGWDGIQGPLAHTQGLARQLSSVKLLAPLRNPQKIFAIGLNYADHIAEMQLAKPAHQVWFAKHGNCITGPCGTIEIPKVSSQVDYEVELVVVIGRRGRHITREAAADHVFGYCVGNDVSVRDWQRQTPQWVLGKSFDTHAPLGPWITTADEIGNPHRLAIRCLVNGEIRQQSNTRELLFSVWDQIAHLSQAMTLEPGDLIFTGTPGGVGAARNPPVWLKAGDRVRCEIEGLGALDNTLTAEVE